MRKLITLVSRLNVLLSSEYAIIRSDHKVMSSEEYKTLRKLCNDINSELERHLTQQCSGREIAEAFCLDCGFDYGSSNCQGCEHYSRR